MAMVANACTRRAAAGGFGRPRPRASGAGGQERGQPRPHRVQLPHVAEVAEDGEPRLAVRARRSPASDQENGPPRERERARRGTRGPPGAAPATPPADTDSTTVCHRAPFRGAASRYGQRLAHRERADQRADGQPARGPEPRGHHLHGRRIDAGQEDAGREPRRQRGAGYAGAAMSAALDAAAPSAHTRDQRPAAHEVGQVEDRRGGRPHHEPELHGRGEPARLRRVRGPTARRAAGATAFPTNQGAIPSSCASAEDEQRPPPRGVLVRVHRARRRWSPRITSRPVVK